MNPILIKLYKYHFNNQLNPRFRIIGTKHKKLIFCKFSSESSGFYRFFNKFGTFE